MVPNLSFRKRWPFFAHNFKRTSIRYRLPLCPVQHHAVSWANIVAKTNKFPFPMILVWGRKWVNIARYSVEDHLIGWSYPFCLWETNGRTSERTSEADPTTLFHPIFGGKPSVSSVRFEADRTLDGVKKRLKTPALSIFRVFVALCS